jgi:hypothetical protein
MLRVYAFDPSRGARFENKLTVKIPYEALKRGPHGRKVAVIDYDASNQCYYEGIDLDAAAVLGQNGLEPSETNPQFHQQMVYAVAMDTIRRFETALGREIHWRPDRHPRGSPFHRVLKIYPHAFQEANAFYDPKIRALLFGYFLASKVDAGTNLPGQIVFTCLSHDIVAHETTHAILDGIRQFFSDPTGPDAAAFHEGFADIVALLQHFSYKESLLDTIQRTGGFIHRKQLAADAPREGAIAAIQAEIGEDNPMVDLARQFGEAMGYRKALRSALGTPQDPTVLERTFEPHDRGAILVAAVFDAFFSVYVSRTRDLVRMAYPDGRDAVPNFLNADLANRLAGEAAETATRIQAICLRALDYCPPVDITFGDYLRALVTADRDIEVEDPMGYRAALINAFRARGIRPEGVVSYGEEALNWNLYQRTDGHQRSRAFARVWRDVIDLEEDSEGDASALYRRLWGNARRYHGKLGLAARVPIQAKSINTLHRLRPDGSLQQQIVAEIVQQRHAPYDPSDRKGRTFVFRGGTTLLINRQGDVRYAISKPIKGAEGHAREERQRQFLQQLESSFALAPYVAFDPKHDYGFKAVHRGY